MVHPGTGNWTAAEIQIPRLEETGLNRVKVLAANIREFLKLLGVGYSEFGPRYLEGEPDGPESASALRAWLAEEFGIEAPSTAGPILAEARRLHPEVGDWIRTWQERRRGV
jgi:hypothetical protein